MTVPVVGSAICLAFTESTDGKGNGYTANCACFYGACAL